MTTIKSKKDFNNFCNSVHLVIASLLETYGLIEIKNTKSSVKQLVASFLGFKSDENINNYLELSCTNQIEINYIFEFASEKKYSSDINRDLILFYEACSIASAQYLNIIEYSYVGIVNQIMSLDDSETIHDLEERLGTLPETFYYSSIKNSHSELSTITLLLSLETLEIFLPNAEKEDILTNCINLYLPAEQPIGLLKKALHCDEVIDCIKIMRTNLRNLIHGDELTLYGESLLTTLIRFPQFWCRSNFKFVNALERFNAYVDPDKPSRVRYLKYQDNTVIELDDKSLNLVFISALYVPERDVIEHLKEHIPIGFRLHSNFDEGEVYKTAIAIFLEAVLFKRVHYRTDNLYQFHIPHIWGCHIDTDSIVEEMKSVFENKFNCFDSSRWSTSMVIIRRSNKEKTTDKISKIIFEADNNIKKYTYILIIRQAPRYKIWKRYNQISSHKHDRVLSEHFSNYESALHYLHTKINAAEDIEAEYLIFNEDDYRNINDIRQDYDINFKCKPHIFSSVAHAERIDIVNEHSSAIVKLRHPLFYENEGYFVTDENNCFMLKSRIYNVY